MNVIVLPVATASTDRRLCWLCQLQLLRLVSPRDRWLMTVSMWRVSRKEMGHLIANCTAAKARRGRPRKQNKQQCTACGLMHDAVNCAAVRTWRVVYTSLSRKLLRGVIVPENNYASVEVDFATEDARMVAGHMYQKHHRRYGAFVAKPKTWLTSLPVITLHRLTIDVIDQVFKWRSLKCKEFYYFKYCMYINSKIITLM